MKRRFTAGTMLAVALALAISTVAGAVSLYFREVSSARQNLRELLGIMEAQAAEADAAGFFNAVDAVAPDKRLTLIAPDGTVLADTGSDSTENHLLRPEVQKALRSGWGESSRRSETLGTSMLYVAKRFADGTVARAAMPLHTVDTLVWTGLPPLFFAALAALALAFALSRRFSRRLTRPLEAVDSALRRALDGSDGDSLSQYADDDELRPILRDIQRLIGRLGEDYANLRAERDKVNLILDCMGEGLILLDGEGEILAINRAARELLELPEEGNGGAPVLLRSRKVAQTIEAARLDRRPAVLDLEAPALGERELRLFLSPVTGRRYEGQTVGTSILITDVTELKRAENARSEFTANVSHELKTPLTSIKGFSDMLAAGMVMDGEDQKRFLTMIGVEVDRLISLINDILELSELESVTIDQPRESASPLEVAGEVKNLLAAQAADRGAVITVSGQEGNVRIPLQRLKELLLNLMENAVKYGRDSGGRVDVAVSRAADSMEITVSDDGIGIPKEAQSRVFERFYRVDKGRSRQNGGTGLGLAIVKHICRLYGGSVSVESVPGEGSVFTVVLPAE